MRLIIGRLVQFIFLFAIWFLLTYPFDDQEVIAGLIVSFILVILPLPGQKLFEEVRLSPKALASMFLLFFVFIFQLVKANLDVAFRVIKPRISINPGIVKVRTSLTSLLGRALLANAITLTPGTITVEVKGEFFYVHWIDVKTKDVEKATKQIVRVFERFLEVGCG